MGWHERFRASLLLGGLCLLSLPAGAQERIYRDGFETPRDLPADRNAAARFLTQATFGPTRQDIDRVMLLGYRGWVEEQLAMPPTLGRVAVEEIISAQIAAGQQYSQRTRYNQWAKQAIYAPDQLRQRMAFALSQIFVVSDQPSNLQYDVIPMTDYYDMLATHGTGSFRTVLDKVTHHPSMGKYLSALHNRKASETTQPDENFAREIMQLFSVGLVNRYLDYSPMLDANGNPQPSYDQQDITNTAKVFTGFAYSDAPLNAFTFGPYSHAGARAPMVCWGTELFPAESPFMMHDITPKIVIGGMTIPAGQTCADDVSDMLDILAGHNNVAPFIARQLIQRFVTSNPSPAYIQRVAEKFEDNGRGERGDLGAVLAAVLLDTEARNPPPLAAGDSYGKLREPLLRLTAMWRAWDAVPTAPNQWGEVRLTANISLPENYKQGPMSAPSVFNFYQPDYQPPGVFTDTNRYAPEMQVVSEATTFSASNVHYQFLSPDFLNPESPPGDRPLLDLSTLTENINDPATVVDIVNERMLYGTMSAGMRQTLIEMLDLLTQYGETPYNKAVSVVYITMISPEYATQR